MPPPLKGGEADAQEEVAEKRGVCAAVCSLVLSIPSLVGT